jgi:hypothetical protein
MRRRHVRTIREEERPTLLLMAAGAVAGAAAGLYLGRRYRSMDAFLDDVRARFADLRDVWNDEGLSAEDRARLGADVAHLDEWDEEDDEEFEEDDLDGAPYENSETFGDDDAEASLDDYEDDDELEEDLAAVTRDNGTAGSSRRAEDQAARLEQRVLQALTSEPVLSARAIEIAVVGEGVVELTGAVNTIEEVARASSLTRGVPVVTMVLNRIVVRSGGNIDTASVPRNPVEAPATDELLDANE